MVKQACVIHYWGERFKDIGLCAKNSFKKFHPDVDLFHIHEGNEHTFKSLADAKYSNIVKAGKRLLIAKELMEVRGYDTVVILGADTITCSYLHEFFVTDENRPDIISTFDYDYPHMTNGHTTPSNAEHLNADAVSFNSVKAIDAILNFLEDSKGTETPTHLDKPKGEQYGEQAALNRVFYGNNGISGAWAEATPLNSFYYHNVHQMSDVVPLCCYNVRSKSTYFTDVRDEHGNRVFQYSKVLCESDHKPWKPFTQRFRAGIAGHPPGSTDTMLFTGDGRQIKLWHYCDGFGSGSKEEMEVSLSRWKTEFFNEATKKFFREECDCAFFFPEGE